MSMQPRHRRRRVARMQRGEHEVTRERRLHRDVRRLEVADLAHHDDVGVLAQEGSQRGGEGEADVVTRLHLVHAEERELDRVLHRADVDAWRVELGERGIEGRGLAAAGGTRHQHQAARACDGRTQLVQRARLEAEAPEVALEVAPVQDAQDELLAERRGEHGDPHVGLLTLRRPEAHAPVLRQPALGDVELREHLQARRDGAVEGQWRVHHLAQHAVDAEADA